MTLFPTENTPHEYLQDAQYCLVRVRHEAKRLKDFLPKKVDKPDADIEADVVEYCASIVKWAEERLRDLDTWQEDHVILALGEKFLLWSTQQEPNLSPGVSSDKGYKYVTATVNGLQKLLRKALVGLQPAAKHRGDCKSYQDEVDSILELGQALVEKCNSKGTEGIKDEEEDDAQARVLKLYRKRALARTTIGRDVESNAPQ